MSRITKRKGELMSAILTRVSLGLVVSFFIGFSVIVLAQARVTDKLMVKFDNLVQGEFDNYNQVNFQQNDFLNEADKPTKKHARLYWSVKRIHAPLLGEYVYSKQIHAGGKDKPIYRQSIQIASPNYQKNTIVAENYTFKNPKDFVGIQALESKAKSLSRSDLSAVGEQCHSEYRQQGSNFVGGIDKSICRVKSKKYDFIHLSTQQVYSEQEFWHLEEGFLSSGKEVFGREDNIPHKLRRATNYKCWAAFKTKKKKPNGDYYWDFHQNIIIHNQGDIANFTTTDKQPKHYFIRLKETIFPAGGRPDVFEMFIHETSESAKENYKEALSYTWTNSKADRLGINLRWMQASCSTSM